MSMKVNINEFQTKYGALIPQDIAAHFNDCFLSGVEETDVRDTVFDEMKIEQFYNEHQQLRPQTDWQTVALSRKVIDLLRSYIINKVQKSDVDALIKQIAIIIDARKVKNEDAHELEALYDDVMWLKCDILKYE